MFSFNNNSLFFKEVILVIFLELTRRYDYINNNTICLQFALYITVLLLLLISLYYICTL